MSLVNQMLQDLETRLEDHRAPRGDALEGLRAAGPARPKRRPWPLTLFALILLAAVAAASALTWWWLRPTPASMTAAESTPIGKLAGADLAGADLAGADPTRAGPAGADPAGADPAGADPAGAGPAAPAAPPPASAPEMAPSGTRLTGIRVWHDRRRTRLDLDLDRAVDYRLEQSPDRDRLRLLLPDVRLTAPLPDNLLDGRLVRGLRSGERSGELFLELDLGMPIRVQSSLITPDGSLTPQLSLLLSDASAPTPPADTRPATAAIPPAAADRAAADRAAADRAAADRAAADRAAADPPRPKAPAPVKQPPTPDPAQQARQDYAAALRLLSRGRDGDAEQRLEAAVARDPNLHAARESLAALYVQAGRADAARRLLEQGLQTHPDNAALARLQARLLVDEGGLDPAVTLLETALPQGAADPDYLALLAALYQRQNRPREAAQTYSAALRLRDDRGAWWAGLGIALEAAGDPAQARQAYLAARSRSLVPDLRGYVDNRLRVLDP